MTAPSNTTTRVLLELTDAGRTRRHELAATTREGRDVAAALRRAADDIDAWVALRADLRMLPEAES